MKQKLFDVRIAMAAFSMLLATSAVGQRNASLKVGDPAPAIQEVKWVQGAPITTFEKGKVYVFEFWATWCGPCIAAMPHLSELSKQYSDKAVFVGVSVFEDNHGPKGADPALAKVQKFMKENPGRMTYSVCVDAGAQDSYFGKTWHKAAGQATIPTTFVIDQQGKIAWIGHPTALDDVLPYVIDGTFDLATFREKQAIKQREQRAAQAARDALIAPAQEALRANDYPKAIHLANEAMEKGGATTFSYAMQIKITATHQLKDEASMQAVLKEIIEKRKAGSYSLDIAKDLLQKDALQAETYDLTAQWLEVLFQVTTGLNRSPENYSLIGKLYEKADKYGDAARIMEKGIEIGKYEGRTNAARMAEYEKELAKYKDMASKQAQK